MFLDVEGGALNIKIAVASDAPETAAALVRRLSARTPSDRDGELVEPERGKIRLVGFDWFVRERALATGEVAHPHVYAIEASAEEPMTSYEWSALLHGADAVARVNADDELEAAIESAIAAALEEAAALPREARGDDAYGFVIVTCPWCSEDVELTVEADVEGSFVQDCEVCCRPWAVAVSRDDAGELLVEIARAQ